MAKRLFDLVVGTALAIIATPVILVLAFAVAVSLRAWPFFVQERVGRGGERFRFVKLRSLPTSCPRYASKYAIADVEAPRLTRWLRGTHLDELPQLFLVVAGKMSLVGPRPEMRNILEGGDESFARVRQSVKPGCTGLWQISERCVAMISESPEYDVYYVRYGSLRLDLWVMWRTALLMLGMAPVVTLAQIPEWTAPTGGTIATRRHARVANGRAAGAEGALLNATELAA